MDIDAAVDTVLSGFQYQHLNLVYNLAFITMVAIRAYYNEINHNGT